MIEMKNGYAQYDCGCKFKIIKKDKPFPIYLDFTPRVEYLPHDCSKTWDLISEGNTKGVFQLESRFSQQIAKRLQPNNIEHLAALSAIIRPGCTQSVRDGKNVTDHYIDRKQGLEPVNYFHPAIQPILETTYGEMIYQEQAMQIAQVLAGFDLQQADVLRKAIGKKKADIMAKVKVEFLEGCSKVGIIDNDQAEQIFGWIEKSQRYSFNKSHAVCYAMNSYLGAYCKAHFPLPFFTSYLWYAKDKQNTFDEIKLLVSNCKMMGIDVYPPDFRNSHNHFKRLTSQLVDNNTYNSFDDKIYFGFADIKNVGENSVKKIAPAIYNAETCLNKHRAEWSWLEFLVYFSHELGISSTIIEGLIETGALGYMKVSRNKMLFEYNKYSSLTSKERAWIKQRVGKCKTLEELLTMALSPYNQSTKSKVKIDGPCANKNRVKILQKILDAVKNPSYSLEDTPDWVARVEDARLGISITATALDSCKDVNQANCTIIDFLKHKEKNHGIFIACQIEEIKTHIAANDKEMAFIVVNDGDCAMDCVAFNNVWEEIRKKSCCTKENTVMISGDRSNKGSFIIKKMWQLS